MKNYAWAAIFVLVTGCVAPDGTRETADAPITIEKQGAFSVGGKILGDDQASLHCDHGYVEYQIPLRATSQQSSDVAQRRGRRLDESLGWRRGIPEHFPATRLSRFTSGTARRWAARTGAAPITSTKPPPAATSATSTPGASARSTCSGSTVCSSLPRTPRPGTRPPARATWNSIRSRTPSCSRTPRRS